MNLRIENHKSGNLIVAIILVLLLAVAVFTRIWGHNRISMYSIDEGTYVMLGHKLMKKPLDYNTKDTYNLYLEKGRKLSAYFNKPLFKHPPVFSYLIAMDFLVTNPSSFREGYNMAVLVSILSGVLLILVTFFLGKIIYNRTIGLIAASIMVVDPIHWLCSQRVWMETTLTLLFWLAVLVVIKAITEKKNLYFYIAAIVTASALLTKYNAFLIYPIIFGFILSTDRSVFKNKHLWMWLAISLTLFSPWLLWNWCVYGKFFIKQILFINIESTRLFLSAANLKYSILMTCIGIIFYFSHRWISKRPYPVRSQIMKKTTGFFVIGGLCLIFLQPYTLSGIINMFNLNYIPHVGNGSSLGVFSKEPWVFYLRRLLELSPFYLFSFMAFLFLLKPEKRDALPYMSVFLVLLAGILWKNYQCRYILMAIPPLVILAAKTINWIWRRSEKISSKNLRLFALILTFAMVAVMLVKVILTGSALALVIHPIYF